MNFLFKFILIAIIGCILLFSDISSLGDVHVQVPALVQKGQPAILSCLYNLEGEKLHSVQWHKNKTLFHMYTPDDNQDNLQVETSSNGTQIYNIQVSDAKYNMSQVITLNVGPEYSGKYSCTVTSTKTKGLPAFLSAWDEGEIIVTDKEHVTTNESPCVERTTTMKTCRNGYNIHNYDLRRFEELQERQINIMSEFSSSQISLANAVTRFVDVHVEKTAYCTQSRKGLASSQDVTCVSPYVQVGNNCYFFSDVCANCNKNWFAAKEDCMRNRNGVIAILDTPEKMNTMRKYLQDNYKNEGSFWIGGSSLATDGTMWVWDPTSESISYTDWLPGQPDNGGGVERCLEIFGNFNTNWNDNTCTKTGRYICQLVADTNKNELF